MQNEPLFRIAVDNEIELEAEVPSIHAVSDSPGQTARIQIEDSRSCRVAFARRRLLSISATQLGQSAPLSLSRDPVAAPAECLLAPPSTRTAAAEFRFRAPRYTTGPRGRGSRSCATTSSRREVVQVGFHSDMDIEIREGLREGDLIAWRTRAVRCATATK